MTDISSRTNVFALPSSLPFSQGMERYLQLLQRQAEISCELAAGWAGAWRTMSGAVLTQTSTTGQAMAVQAGQIAEQATAVDTAPAPAHGSSPVTQESRDPSMSSAHGAATHHESMVDWSTEEERLRNNVFDEVVARLLDNDIVEAVV
jgi:hypothetical protein